MTAGLLESFALVLHKHNLCSQTATCTDKQHSQELGALMEHEPDKCDHLGRVRY
jgi:hypothetical protein